MPPKKKGYFPISPKDDDNEKRLKKSATTTSKLPVTTSININGSFTTTSKPPITSSSKNFEILNSGIKYQYQPNTGSFETSVNSSTENFHLYSQEPPPNVVLQDNDLSSQEIPFNLNLRANSVVMRLRDAAFPSMATDTEKKLPNFPPSSWDSTTLLEIVNPTYSKCSICLVEPLENPAALNSCTHCYCFECIKKWSEKRTICPLCMAEFSHLYHDVQSNSVYKVFIVPKVSQTSSEDIDYILPWIHRRYMFWVSRFEHVRSQNRLMHDRLPRVAGDENRSAAVLANCGVHTVRMQRILYERDIRSSHISGIVRVDVSRAFFRNNAIEVQRLYPFIRRELIFLFGFNNRRLITPLTRAIVPLLGQPGLQNEMINVHLSPVLGKFTDRFLHELVSFARTNLDLSTYDSAVIFPPLEHLSDDRIVRGPVVPLSDTAMRSRIIRAALGQHQNRVITDIKPPLEGEGDAVFYSTFVQDSQREFQLQSITSRPRFNHEPQMPEIVVPPPTNLRCREICSSNSSNNPWPKINDVTSFERTPRLRNHIWTSSLEEALDLTSNSSRSSNTDSAPGTSGINSNSKALDLSKLKCSKTTNQNYIHHQTPISPYFRVYPHNQTQKSSSCSYATSPSGYTLHYSGVETVQSAASHTGFATESRMSTKITNDVSDKLTSKKKVFTRIQHLYGNELSQAFYKSRKRRNPNDSSDDEEDFQINDSTHILDKKEEFLSQKKK